MSRERVSHAEVKAGLFLTFCMGLLIAMLFVYGKFNRTWRGQRDLQVYFTHVASMRPDALVRYNGMEVGRVRRTHIVELGPETLEQFPELTGQDLENLPLTDDEREVVRGLTGSRLDAAIRKLLPGRSMVALTLEVLAEDDAKRFRERDQIRIASNFMGESFVEIISGGGQPVPPTSTRIAIGVSGDMYSDLAKSLDQVKGILSSVSEIMGGGQHAPMAQRVLNFDKFTERLDQLASTLAHDLPKTWDGLDAKMDESRDRIHTLGKALHEMKPELVGVFQNTAKSLEDWRGKLSSMVEGGRKQVRELREALGKDLRSLGDLAKEQKGKIPLVVRDARVWTEQVAGRVETIDRLMTESDRTLREGFESARQSFKGFRELADAFEEKTWYLANHPWSLMQTPERLEGQQLDAEWRKNLLARHYHELRGELDSARTKIQVQDTSDRARLARIGQIMQEIDEYLKVPRASKGALPAGGRPDGRAPGR